MPLAAIVFFNVSGGPYGVEDAVSPSAPASRCSSSCSRPLSGACRSSLAMAELAAAMPDEGGYVTWVRRAFGPFWALPGRLVVAGSTASWTSPSIPRSSSST